MKMKCVKLDPSAKSLVRSTDGSAGFDVSICDNYEITQMKKLQIENPKALSKYPKVTTLSTKSIRIADSMYGRLYHITPDGHQVDMEFPSYTFSIEPGKTATIHTGLIVEIPEGYVGMLCARSGISNHYGITPRDCIGIIDSDYRGELIIHLVNNSNEEYFLSPNERVCQLIITPYVAPEIEYADTPTETKRGSNGFGSTGV